MHLKSSSVTETEKIGAALGALAFSGMVVVLSGELGAGKTAFSRGVARGLGVRGPVTSPTFTLINEYTGRLPLYHFDVYRLNDPVELADLGYEEYLEDEGVCLIEWGDLVQEWLPKEHLKVQLKGQGDTRTLTFTAQGQRYEKLIKELKARVDSGPGDSHARS
jgi:tRNA threonylcarbamoyladenosine biosynthesis protein TsaE